MPQLKTETDFTIEFSGETSEIDVNVLLTSLLNFNTAIQEIKQSIFPDAKLDIKVKPFGEGSFLLHLGMNLPDLLPIGSAALLGLIENIPFIQQVLSIFANSISIKKFLDGNPPKEISKELPDGNIQIINHNGDTLNINATTVNVYMGNPKLDKAFSNAFSSISTQDNIEGLKIKDANNNVLSEAKAEYFAPMSKQIEYVDSDKRDILKSNATLQIIRLYFEEGHTWSFVYEGNKISAKVTDPLFYKRINNNEAFAKGDYLTVDLKVYQKYDSSLMAWLNTGFEVVSVTDHKKAEQQSSLF